jgi:excisionase family DNA binding protein
MTKYLRTSQVAKILGVTVNTARTWAQQGKLPYAKTLGNHRRYPEPEIVALRDQLTQPTNTDRQP